MTTIASLLEMSISQLKQAGVDSARLDAGLLMAHVSGLPREQLLIAGDNALSDKEIAQFNALIARRMAHEPVAYIIGKKEFWSLDFYVTRDTLIPRPDSETLVAAALKRIKNLTAHDHPQGKSQARPITLLDIGTGTACLLVALLKELPEAKGIGVDTSKRALQVAKDNAKLHGVQSRAEFAQSYWCDAISGTFDLIISNPPYIAEAELAGLMPDVLRYEPHLALVAGADGLDAYRAIAPQLPSLLNAGGYVLFEVGEGQDAAVEKLLQGQGMITEPAEKDLAGIARCVIARKMKPTDY